jgi:hypothetical protein
MKREMTLPEFRYDAIMEELYRLSKEGELDAAIDSKASEDRF